MKKSTTLLFTLLICTFSALTFAQSKPSIKGTWTEYRPDGSKVTTYKIKIFQISGKTTISIVGQRGNALITGNKITVDNMRYWGRISKNGNRIDWSNKSFWLKDIPKKPKTTRPSTRPKPKATPRPRTSSPPRRTTQPRRNSPTTNRIPGRISLEQQCFNMIQGKVAWSKNGSKRWANNNVRKLCAGIKNPSALVACFKSQINQNKNWQTAMNYCKKGSVPRTNVGNTPQRKFINIAGTWLVYFTDGKVGTIPMKITQSKQVFTFDTGASNKKDKGAISGKAIYVGGKKIGDIADDGRLIRLTNGVIWVKR